MCTRYTPSIALNHSAPAAVGMMKPETLTRIRLVSGAESCGDMITAAPLQSCKYRWLRVPATYFLSGAYGESALTEL